MTDPHGKAQAIRDEAWRLNLVDAWRLYKLTDEQIVSNSNGIGCEAMPAPLRSALGRLHPCMVLPSVIHDLHWTFFNRGTREDFERSNAVFASNTIIVACDRYRWWHPRRYLECWSAWRYRRLLDRFGWPIYTAAV